MSANSTSPWPRYLVIFTEDFKRDIALANDVVECRLMRSYRTTIVCDAFTFNGIAFWPLYSGTILEIIGVKFC